MEKRNFVTSKRSPDNLSSDDAMIKSAAEKFGECFKDTSYLKAAISEDLVKKASAEDEKTDVAE